MNHLLSWLSKSKKLYLLLKYKVKDNFDFVLQMWFNINYYQWVSTTPHEYVVGECFQKTWEWEWTSFLMYVMHPGFAIGANCITIIFN